MSFQFFEYLGFGWVFIKSLKSRANLEKAKWIRVKILVCFNF